MIDPTFKPAPSFTLHPAIKLQGFQLTCNGGSLLDKPRLVRETPSSLVFETCTKVLDRWVRTRARFNSGSPRVRFWWWAIAGDESISLPIISSKALEMDQLSMCVARDTMLQGQGWVVKSAVYEFANKAWSGGANPLVSVYAPTTPNRTGGDWPYMGYDFTRTFNTLEEARHALYPLGVYGGNFLRQHDGSFLREVDRLSLIGRSHIHERSKDPGWIAYSDPDAHWKDKHPQGYQNQDEEHLCLWNPLAAAARVWPEDEGFQMLLEAAGVLYERQVPNFEKGTTHHTSGPERAQGRILLTGVDLAGVRSPVWGVDPATRATERWEIDSQAAFERMEKGLPPWHQFGDHAGISPSEVGIHYGGLRKLEAFGGGGDSLAGQLRDAARYCFESFLDWDELPGDRVLAVPYWRYYDGAPWGGPSSTGHFCWLAAINVEPRNDVEREKLKRIYDLGEHVPERFRTVR